MAKEENQQKELPTKQSLKPSFGPGSHSGSPEKKSWPELVGLASEEAERRISEEMQGAKIQVIPQDSFVTMDFRLDRVRIFTDPAGKVAREPRIG